LRHRPSPLVFGTKMTEPLDSTTKILKQDLDSHHLDTFIEHLNADLTNPNLTPQKKALLDQAHGLLVQAHLIPDTQLIDGVQSGTVKLHDASGKILALNAQGQDLATEDVGPPKPVASSSRAGAHKSYSEARHDASIASAKDVNEKDAHAIAYGDTLWDIAKASFKKHNGHDASDLEVANEVSRIAKKNGVNPNSIALGTTIHTDMNGSPEAPQAANPPERRTTTASLDPATANLTNGQTTGGEALRPPDTRLAADHGTGGTRGTTPIPEAQGSASERTGDQGSADRGTNGDSPLLADNGDVPATAIPTPRDASWMQQHSNLVQKAQQSDADVVFFGDSITDGMSLNSEFRNGFGERAQNFGITSDQTQNLLWRLENGEADFRAKSPQKAVLMIGTNDIGKASTDDIVKGILANARLLQQKLPNSQLLVVGVLPRGESPNDPLRRTVAEINRKVRTALAGTNVQFADVGNRMLDSQGRMIAGVWQGDHTHPTYGPGYDALFDGLKTYV
jgi:lysophospholipase L1-like esterase